MAGGSEAAPPPHPFPRPLFKEMAMAVGSANSGVLGLCHLVGSRSDRGATW